MGSDTLLEMIQIKLKMFQSTLPHGERLTNIYTLFFLFRFQSTLPHGERPFGDAWAKSGHKFQSTLPHGERR